MKNLTSKVVLKPEDTTIIESKFVLDMKLNSDDTVKWYKARWVVNGFQEVSNCTSYAPVIDFT